MGSGGMPKIVATVGLCGAGKSEVANQFVELGLAYLRFGQITLDKLREQGLDVSEVNEKKIREGLRQEHGMGAYAILNLPKIDELIAQGKDVLIDGLYSWTEYKILKEKYGDDLTIVAVYAPPQVRYARLHDRGRRHEINEHNRHRSIPIADAQSRDYAEIENIEKAGPIAMAEFTVHNIGTVDDIRHQVSDIAAALRLNQS